MMSSCCGGEMSQTAISPAKMMVVKIAASILSLVLVGTANAQQPFPKKRLDAITNTGQDSESALKSYLDEIRSRSQRLGELDALYRSALASEADGQLTEAAEGYRKLYQEEPGNARGFGGTARVYFAQQRRQELESLLQAEIGRQPKRPDIRLAFVDAARQMHEDDLAIVNLAKWLSDPDMNAGARAEFNLRLGVIYEQRGDTNSALAAISVANELRPGHMATRLALARQFDAAGRTDEAVKVHRDLLGVDPGDVEALRTRAMVLSDVGDLERAQVCAQLVIRMLPESLNDAAVLGHIYLRLGKGHEAKEVFAGLVAKEPGSAAFRLGLGTAYHSVGDSSLALKEFEQALQSNPSNEELQQIQRLIALANGGKR